MLKAVVCVLVGTRTGGPDGGKVCVQTLQRGLTRPEASCLLSASPSSHPVRAAAPAGSCSHCCSRQHRSRSPAGSTAGGHMGTPVGQDRNPVPPLNKPGSFNRNSSVWMKSTSQAARFTKHPRTKLLGRWTRLHRLLGMLRCVCALGMCVLLRCVCVCAACFENSCEKYRESCFE